IGRAHVVEEDERPDHAPFRDRQDSPDLETSEAEASLVDHKFYHASSACPPVRLRHAGFKPAEQRPARVDLCFGAKMPQPEKTCSMGPTSYRLAGWLTPHLNARPGKCVITRTGTGSRSISVTGRRLP